MSRNQKIEEIDQKLMQTLKLCAAEKICPEEFRSLTRPLRMIHQKWRRRERINSIIFISLVVVVVAVLYQVEATAEFISAVGKIGMVKLVSISSVESLKSVIKLTLTLSEVTPF